MSTKYVYFFENNHADGDASMRNLLGGKGANLAEDDQNRPPVPARLHPLHRCLHLLLRQRPKTAGLKDQVVQALRKVEETMGKVPRQDQPAAPRLPLGARSSRLVLSPNLAPIVSSTLRNACATWSLSSGGYLRPLA